MNFLSRAKTAALAVTHTLRAAVQSPPSSSSSTKYCGPPRDVLTSLVTEVCGIIDQYAVSDEADTVEGDRVLYESSAREHLRRIIDMLAEDGNRWAARQNEGDGPEEGAEHGEEESWQCIDAFLQSNAMHEFCRRAGRDLPRGTLPLVLAFISSLLKQSRYPFLPHVAVYRPVTRLIAVACRLDAVILRTGEVDGGASDPAYARRIDAALTGLLSALWRKVADNPALLEFFVLEDSRRGLMAAHTPQMDILAALRPHLFKPGRTGQTAREALLVALSIRDPRIDAFLIQHTAILPALAEQLSAYFKASTADSFLRLARFCCLVIAVAEGEAGNVRTALTTLFEQRFLLVSLSGLGLVTGATASSSSSSSSSSIAPLASAGAGAHAAAEQVATPEAASLARLLLAELGSFSSQAPLLRVTLAHLLKQRGLVSALALRATSMFPAVAVATAQLIATLLDVATLEEALALLCRSADDDEREAEAEAEADAEAEAGEVGEELGGLASDVDVRLAGACSSVSCPPLAFVDTAAQDLLSHVLLSSSRFGPPPSLSSSSASSSTSSAAGAGAGSGSGIAAPSAAAFNASRSVLFLLAQRRLAGLLGLRMEEQVATASLVTAVATQLSVAVVMGCEQAPRLVGHVQALLTAAKGLQAELDSHLSDMNRGAAKLEAAVALLSAGTGQVSLAAAVKDPASGSALAHVRVLLEPEPPRSIRILEAGVVLGALQSQLAGLLFACARLRAALAGPEGSLLLRQGQEQAEIGTIRAALCPVDEDEERAGEEEDEEEEERERDLALSLGQAPDVVMEAMEREMAALLAALDSPPLEAQ